MASRCLKNFCIPALSYCVGCGIVILSVIVVASLNMNVVTVGSRSGIFEVGTLNRNIDIAFNNSNNISSAYQRTTSVDRSLNTGQSIRS